MVLDMDIKNQRIETNCFVALVNLCHVAAVASEPLREWDRGGPGTQHIRICNWQPWKAWAH